MMGASEDIIYVLKIGKFYLKAIYVDNEYPQTNFINEIELSPNLEYIHTEVKYKNKIDAEYMKDALKELLELYENPSVEIVAIEKI